ncbi:right-handed parallel beta-helix repeat-containing protein [Anaerohalosphaera lusitana]|uniref:right-handed parallel beta-helix repeat-containing protein n=1 Tax=Anaerohalosphaera lusitana TaxID=1936003 RepID=UPI003AAEB1CD
MTLTNPADTPLDWQIEYDCPWLRIEPATGTTPADSSSDITLRIAHTGLPADAYTTTAAITTASDQQNIDLTLTVTIPLRVPADYPTIQAAIDAANPNDTVLIAPGTYTGTGNRDIDFKGKPITVKSSHGPEQTIIDCQGTGQYPHRGFTFKGYKFIKQEIYGLKIINGKAPAGSVGRKGGYPGSAIYIENAAPVIKNCILTSNADFPNTIGTIAINNDTIFEPQTIIENCTIAGNGTSGIRAYKAKLKMTDCLLKDNNQWGMFIDTCSLEAARCKFTLNSQDGVYSDGGYTEPLRFDNCQFINNSFTGIRISSTNEVVILNSLVKGNAGGISTSGTSIRPVIFVQNTAIVSNSSSKPGGGISVYNNGSASLFNCLIADNYAPKGGGAYFTHEKKFKIVNCTFAYNRAMQSAGGLHLEYWADVKVLNSIFWGNRNLSDGTLGSQISAADDYYPVYLLIAFSDIQNGKDGIDVVDKLIDWRDNNILADPLFVDTGYYEDGELQDYDFRLTHPMPDDELKLTLTSPCIDAASNLKVPADQFDVDGDGNVTEKISIDLNGKPRLSYLSSAPDSGQGSGAIVDMGAYEAVGAIPGDFNDDEKTDFSDLTDFSGRWMADGRSLWQPLHEWHFNTGSGSVAEDVGSAGGLDAHLANLENSWTPSRDGYALQFDHNEQVVTVPGYYGITGTQARTVTAWIKTETTWKAILGWGGSLQEGGTWLISVHEDGALRLSVKGGRKIGSALLNDGNWHHVTVVLPEMENPNVTDCKFYVDGRPDEPRIVVPCSIDTVSDKELTIGHWNDRSFMGLIDGVSIYNDELSPEAILSLYVNGRAQTCRYLPEDLTGDCKVNFKDLAVFAQSWLMQ